MSEPIEILRDASVGETREVLIEDGRPIALRLLRWSEAGARARWGEVYRGRVSSVDRRRRGAFLDLGLSGETGFLPLGADGKARGPEGARLALVEGQALRVAITREGVRGKGPVLQVLAADETGRPERLARAEADQELDAARPADRATRARIDAAFEDAGAPRVDIPGGGTLTIEPTAALVAIDVDAGARRGSPDPERFALELNLAAAEEVFRQVRLRALGGLIAVDFVSMNAAESRARLEAALKAGIARDVWGIQGAPLSRFGVAEMARTQILAPLGERMVGPEAEALAALRAIETEAAESRGRWIVAGVSPSARAWLDASTLPAALQTKTGARFAFELGAPGVRLEERS